MQYINHPLCSRVLGAPPGTEEQVGALPVAELRDELGVGLYSFWKPDPDELVALNAGHAVVLGVHSSMHPVVSISVTKEPV